MIWKSWSDFFAMGGYALYVWGSFIVVAVFMAGEVVLVGHRTRTIKAQLQRVHRGNRSSVTPAGLTSTGFTQASASIQADPQAENRRNV